MYNLGNNRNNNAGPQLHETYMGRKFFEHDLPSLIESIQQLTKVLQEKDVIEIGDKEKRMLLDSIKDIATSQVTGDFFKTQQGHKFYEWTLPNIVKELSAVTKALKGEEEQSEAYKEAMKAFK